MSLLCVQCDQLLIGEPIAGVGPEFTKDPVFVTRRGRLAGIFFPAPEVTLPIELKRELFPILSAEIHRQLRRRRLSERDVKADFESWRKRSSSRAQTSSSRRSRWLTVQSCRGDRTMGRTNIVLDDRLIREGLRRFRCRSKRELVHLALTELLKSARRRELLSLRGQVKWEGDFTELRRLRP